MARRSPATASMGAMADPHPAPSSARSGLDGMFSTLRGFGVRRNTDDRWLAGVCSGVADRLGIDPLIVRGALIVLLFVGGLGGLVYLIAWALLPDQNGKILAEAALHGDGWGIALLIVIGIALISNISDRWWLWTILVPVGLLVWWAIHSARQGKTAEQMGEEAREFGNKFAATFSRPPVATPQRRRPHLRRTEPPPMSATTSTTPATPTAPAAPPYGMGPGRTGVVARPRTRRPPPPSARRLPRSAAHRRPRRRGVRPRPVVCGADPASRGLPKLLAAGFAVAGAGLALLVVGLTGRRAGFTAFLVTWRRWPPSAPPRCPRCPAAASASGQWSAASQPADGFSLTAGDAQLSPRRSSAGQHGPRRDGCRTAEHRRPKGTTVTFVPTVKAGQVVVHRAGATGKEVRAGSRARTGSRSPSAAAPPPAPSNIDMVAGELVITEES